MSENVVLSVSVLASLMPASLQALRRTPSRDAIFWVVLAIAVAGPLLWATPQVIGPWQTGLAANLWVTISATMGLYAIAALVTRQAWRLAPLLTSYMLLLGVLATVWRRSVEQPTVAVGGEGGWMGVHIATSLTTYALVTIAAIAALAAFLQERTLKSKRPTTVTRFLPSIADCDALVVQLLKWGEAVLALGLATGMAVQWREMGQLITLNHKTILTLASFIVIGGLLIAHHASGVRGKRAARIVLLAYLLLTLGYPGVKFVSEVLMA